MHAVITFKVGTPRDDIMGAVTKVLTGITDVSQLGANVDVTTSTIAGAVGGEWSFRSQHAVPLTSGIVYTDLERDVVGKPGHKLALRFKWNSSTSSTSPACDVILANVANNVLEFYGHPHTSTTYDASSTANYSSASSTQINIGVGTTLIDQVVAYIVNSDNGTHLTFRIGSGASNVNISRIDFIQPGLANDPNSIPYIIHLSGDWGVGMTRVRNPLTGSYPQEATGTTRSSIIKLTVIGADQPNANSLITQSRPTCDENGNPRSATFPIFVAGEVTSTAFVGLIGNVTSAAGLLYAGTFGGQLQPGDSIEVDGVQHLCLNTYANTTLLAPLV